MRNPKSIAVLVATLFLSLALAAPPAAAGKDNSHLFQTVLLMGRTDGESDLKDVPPNVIEALADVREFLPYRAFSLVDSSLLSSDGEARGRLTGPGGRDFDMAFGFRAGEEPGELMFREFQMDTLVPAPQDGVRIEGGKTTIQHQPTSWVRKRVIGATFSLAVGETIVVGTSKLNGSGEALIVLFTAVR